MAKYVALTVRRLKPGAYDDWRRAWEPDEWPEGVKATIVRSVSDPNEIIAFGVFERDPDELRGPPGDDAEARRQERMAPHVESTGADGLYEVIDEVG